MNQIYQQDQFNHPNSPNDEAIVESVKFQRIPVLEHLVAGTTDACFAMQEIAESIESSKIKAHLEDHFEPKYARAAGTASMHHEVAPPTTEPILDSTKDQTTAFPANIIELRHFRDVVGLHARPADETLREYKEAA